MNEYEITRILKAHPHTKGNFRGTFASDELPLPLIRGVYVVNLSARAEGSGSHWITIYVNRHKIAYYMDSAGEPPTVLSIIYALSSLNFILYNSVQLPSNSSISCGLFAVVCAIFFCRGVGIYELRLLFKQEPHLLSLNEHIIAGLVSKELVTFGASWSRQLAREIRKWRAPRLDIIPPPEMLTMN